MGLWAEGRLRTAAVLPSITYKIKGGFLWARTSSRWGACPAFFLTRSTHGLLLFKTHGLSSPPSPSHTIYTDCFIPSRSDSNFTLFGIYSPPEGGPADDMSSSSANYTALLRSASTPGRTHALLLYYSFQSDGFLLPQLLISWCSTFCCCWVSSHLICCIFDNQNPKGRTDFDVIV